MSYWNDAPRPSVEAEEASLAEIEATALKELSELEKTFREKFTKEKNRFRDMCDTEYWVCACFTTRQQREEFLKNMGFDGDEKYVDGRELARACKRALQSPDMEFAKIRAFDKDFLDRTIKKV